VVVVAEAVEAVVVASATHRPCWTSIGRTLG